MGNYNFLYRGWKRGGMGRNNPFRVEDKGSSPPLNWCCWEVRDPLWPSQFSAPWDHSPGWRFPFSWPCQMEPPFLWLLKTVELVYRRLMGIYVPSALWHIVWCPTSKESWILVEIIEKWQSLKGNALWVWQTEGIIGKQCNHEKGKQEMGLCWPPLGIVLHIDHPL